jgi:ketosteroid isomerase-like protein
VACSSVAAFGYTHGFLDPLESGAERRAAEDVRAVNERFWRAYAERDLWAIDQLWAKGTPVSAVFPADDIVFVGSENVLDSFKRSFAHNRDITISSRVVSVRTQGDIAWLVSAVRFEAVQTQTSESIVMDPMLSTEIFQKANEEWSLVHFHAHFPRFAIPVFDETRTSLQDETTSQVALTDIARASTSFYNCLQSKDIDAMMLAWAPGDSVSAVHPKNPTVFLGRDEVHRSWQEAFSEIGSLRIKQRFTSRRAEGSVAWIVDLNEFDGSLTGNDAIHMPSVLSTQIFTQRGDQWSMVHYHGHIGFPVGGHSD